jgi:Novel STAND NTPase 1/Protein kinase domain
MLDHEPGEVLDGRYRLGERLGRGGFGDVWRADELLPDGSPLREVALKLLRPSAAGADWAAEARIIASLRHPGLVTIYAAGELALKQKIPFVAMELLEGDSLDRPVKAEERIPWRRVLAWAREAAAALDTIHIAGVVHLDLKPANLFLDREGRLKVLDFGIARQGQDDGSAAAALASAAGGDDMSTAAFLVEREHADAGPAVTGATSHYAIGTPGFMAPEIIEGGEATCAADAYALAALMVQLITGRLPQQLPKRPEHTSATTQAWFADVQAATVRGQIRDLAAEHPELPRALLQLFDRWLSLDPAGRRLEPGTMLAALDVAWDCPRGRVDNPFRGLAPYGFVDEGRLYGRTAEINRLGRELVDVPTVVFHGEPGVGLRSLALAGVAPVLARSFADDRHDWLPIVVSLGGLSEGETPDDALRQATSAFMAEVDAEVASDVAADAVATLLRWVDDAPIGVVVMVDDLHRALDHPERDRAALTSLFEEDATVADGMRVLATLRAKHGAEILATPDLGERIRPWLRFIGPLQAGMVDELLLGPAKAAEREVVDSDTITRQLRAELADDGSRLGLLSLALESFWEESGDGPLRAALWQERGGVIGYVQRHADAVVKGLDPERRELADAVFLRLVSVDGESVDVPANEVRERVGDEGGDVVDRLLAARLIREQGEALRLGHPGLINGWTRLHDLRLAHLDRLGLLEELRDATRRWLMAGGARDQVWPPAKIREIDARREAIRRDIGDDERAFIEASRRAARVAWVLRGAALCFVLAVLAGAIWVDRTMTQRAVDQAHRLHLARRSAAIGQMVTQSRRTEDPYLRTALLSGAMELGSPDPALPLELAAASGSLPRAEFLTLAPVSQPSFPWGERWMVGMRGSNMLVVDFDPPAGKDFAPIAFRFEPHQRGIYDFVTFPFDTSFVTRGLDGELAVWRLREDGRVALAAKSPMRCLRGLSPVLVAERAPVIACTTDAGVARWDLRRPDEVAVDPFVGRGLDLSPDGEWLAATRLKKLLLLNLGAKRRHEIPVARPPKLARFSPRDPVLAVVRGDSIEALDLRADPPMVLHRLDTFGGDPVAAHWGPSGVDLALCDYQGRGEWFYLRPGGRAPDDLPPAPSSRPCEQTQSPWPQHLADARAYGPSIAQTDVGPRVFDGGWQLEDGRLLSRDLVMFDPDDRHLHDLLHYDTTSKEPAQMGESAAAVVRDEDQLAWEVAGTIRFHDAEGEELLRRPGRLLGRCPDGRVLGIRQADSGAAWELFGAKNDVLLARIAREPAFVVGVDPACQRAYFQGPEGHLGSVDWASGSKAGDKTIRWRSDALAGFVYDVRRSEGWPEAIGGGLWLALSEGELVRIDATSDGIQSYGSATPRATAMADGPTPGSLLFADATGLVLRSSAMRSEQILEPLPGRAWSDVLRFGESAALLAWSQGVAVVELSRRELVAQLATPSHGRLASWNDEGSALVWPFAYMGQPRGRIIPIGGKLAGTVGQAASNLRAELTSAGPLVHLD